MISNLEIDELVGERFNQLRHAIVSSRRRGGAVRR